MAKATSFRLATQTLPSVLRPQPHAFASWPQLPPSKDSQLKPSSIRTAADANLLSLQPQLAAVGSSVHLAAAAPGLAASVQLTAAAPSVHVAAAPSVLIRPFRGRSSIHL